MPSDAAPIIIVTGLPRSGTSMLMRMLHAGGIVALTDNQRAPDDDNPLGYFELEAVKTTRADASWLGQAPGKAVKVIHALLKDLPPTHRYRIIFMHRDLDEVLASQRKMLDRAGKPGASISSDALKRVYNTQLAAARKWIDSQPGSTCLDLHYHEVIASPAANAARLADFLSIPARASDMAAAVDSTLYRNRKPSA